MAKIELKVYGTARKGHREHWIVKGKGRYRTVRRDRKGHLVSWKKWKPTEPIEKAKYIEVPFEIEAETGREAYQKVVEVYKQWEWVEGTFRVDY